MFLFLFIMFLNISAYKVIEMDLKNSNVFLNLFTNII